MKLLFCISLLVFSVATIVAASQNGPNKSVISYKLDKPLKVDGILDEPLYQKAAITDFTQKEPVEGVPATERTEMWISYDESSIYISGRFYDS